MKKRIAYIYTLLLLMIATLLTTAVSAQGTGLIGPIITGIPVGKSAIQFHDLGTNLMWHIETPISLYHFRYDTGFPRSVWSSDGCYIMLRNDHLAEWSMLNIVDLKIRPFSNSHNIIHHPLWHPTDPYATFVDFNEAENQSNIVLLDYITGSDEILFSQQGQTGLLAWLTPTQLLFSVSGNWLIWDTDTKTSTLFDHLTPPSNTLFHQSHYAPDFSYLAQHYNINLYHQNRWQGYSDGLSTEEFQALNKQVAQSGFTLFELNTGQLKHIAMEDEFVDALRWSSSSNNIIVSTHIGNVYTYNLIEDELVKLEGVIAQFNPEYGSYFPSWSSDERFVSLNTVTEGHIIYNLEDGTYRALNDERAPSNLSAGWSSTYLELFWSHVAAYQSANCLQ